MGTVSCSSEKSPGGNCLTCHEVTLDTHHTISCTTCHNGNIEGETEQIAHENLIAQPAHPDHMQQACAPCHESHTENLLSSSHLRIYGYPNMVRNAFGAPESVQSFLNVPVHPEIASSWQLADDLLRRRCLRCHLYSNGDNYPSTIHGTGCAACHMQVGKESRKNHTFYKTPQDSNCLSCHYGNRVGFDYYGRFEHDFHDEYRTPYLQEESRERVFGVEYHQLSPDIHQQKGLICVDCHSGEQLMSEQEEQSQVTCATCHDSILLANGRLPMIEQSGDRYMFSSKSGSEPVALPMMSHTAHQSTDKVDCQVCHAQWSFNDTGTHLLRSDLDEYDHWYHLTVQGSYEVEQFLKNNLDFDKDEFPPQTTDKITGDKRPGVWYKGYLMRRWEEVLVGRDQSGILRVMRPALEIHLSWVDDNGTLRFDNITPEDTNKIMVPYTPHTTGHAGLYYQDRLNRTPDPLPGAPAKQTAEPSSQ